MAAAGESKAAGAAAKNKYAGEVVRVDARAARIAAREAAGEEAPSLFGR